MSIIYTSIFIIHKILLHEEFIKILKLKSLFQFIWFEKVCNDNVRWHQLPKEYGECLFWCAAYSFKWRLIIIEGWGSIGRVRRVWLEIEEWSKGWEWRGQVVRVDNKWEKKMWGYLLTFVSCTQSMHHLLLSYLTRFIYTYKYIYIYVPIHNIIFTIYLSHPIINLTMKIIPHSHFNMEESA